MLRALKPGATLPPLPLLPPLPAPRSDTMSASSSTRARSPRVASHCQSSHHLLETDHALTHLPDFDACSGGFWPTRSTSPSSALTFSPLMTLGELAEPRQSISVYFKAESTVPWSPLRYNFRIPKRCQLRHLAVVTPGTQYIGSSWVSACAEGRCSSTRPKPWRPRSTTSRSSPRRPRRMIDFQVRLSCVRVGVASVCVITAPRSAPAPRCAEVRRIKGHNAGAAMVAAILALGGPEAVTSYALMAPTAPHVGVFRGVHSSRISPDIAMLAKKKGKGKKGKKSSAARPPPSPTPPAAAEAAFEAVPTPMPASPIAPASDQTPLAPPFDGAMAAAPSPLPPPPEVPPPQQLT